MIVDFKPKDKDAIEILSVFPVSEVEEEEYPVGVFFSSGGRKYMTYADNSDFEEAARKSLEEDKRVRFEDLLDVTQIVVCIILNTGDDFYGRQHCRESFEQDAKIPWPRAVYNLMHDIVKHRLHQFFHYGDGEDDLCVYLDILSKISFPLKPLRRAF